MKLLSAAAAALILAAASPAAAAPADCDALLDWMSGRWTGAFMGGTAEEWLSSPQDGVSVGMFRLVAGGELRFTEHFQFARTPAGIEARIKHFHADHRGWEEKDEIVRFAPVSCDRDALVFEGMSYRRGPTPDLMIASIELDHGDGRRSTETITYRRAP